MAFSFTAVFQRSRNKGFGNGAEVFSGYRFVRLLRFVAAIYGVRELLWFPLKSANFPKFCNTYYQKSKHSKSFLWTCDSAVINNVTVDRCIIMGKNY